MEHREHHVHSVTEAHESHTVDVHSRMVKYSLTMGIRVACFVAAFFLRESWLVWVALAGAVFLPWVAVVIANGTSKDHLRTSDAHFVDEPPRAALESQPATSQPEDPHSVTLEGEFLDDAPADPPGGTGSNKHRYDGGSAA